MKKLIRRLPLSVVPLAFCLPIEAAEQPQPVSDDGAKLSTVVVQGKLEKDKQDIDKKQLENSNLGIASDVTKSTTNVSAATYDGHLRPMWFIRGIGTGDNNANTVQPTTIYLDDVYQGALLGTGFPLFDMQSAEILKGPQGTTFGTNATAGAIRFSSKAPGFDNQGYGKVGIGNYSARLYELGQDINIVDQKVAARVSLHSESRDSFYENKSGSNFNPLRDDAARIQFLVKPDDVSDLLIGLNYRDYGDDGNIRFPRGTTAGRTSFGYITNESQHLLSLNTPTWSDLRQFGASIKYGRDFDQYRFESITAAQHIEYKDQTDSDYTPVEVGRTRTGTHYNQYSQEFRIKSEYDGAWDWQAGLFLYHQNVDNWRARGALPGGAVAASYNNVEYVQDTEQAALFGGVHYRFNDRARVDLNVRQSHIDKAIELSRVQASGTPLYNNLGEWWKKSSLNRLTQNVDQDDKVRWNITTWDIRPEYDFSENLTGYLKYAKGFREGAYNTSITQQAETGLVKPEYLDSYEVGFKSHWFDNTLLLNASAFYYDYEDIQVSVTKATTTGTVGNLTNGAKGKAHGAEVELKWSPDRSLDLYAGLALLSTRYASFVTDTADNTGNDFPRAPKRTATLTATKRLYLDNGFTLEGSLNLKYSGSFYMFGTNQTTHMYRQGGFSVLGGKLALYSPGKDVVVSLYGDNIFDKKYYEHRVTPSNGEYTFAYGAPREFGVTLEKKW
ncbi:TonB-dependent receptor [Pseudomonas sp. LRF_L74]|uniref:TonB-dependent receptor n=1 Tax=Pseudomonas sp. LRF_L74 TaxID=3369422 RepID=UPI003F632B0C